MLRVRGLTMRYPNGKLALAGFDLNVEAGELVVVLGGNGSGKTTLLRCISRMLRPTAGEILLSSTDLTKLSGERLRQARLPLAMIWAGPSTPASRTLALHPRGWPTFVASAAISLACCSFSAISVT